MWKQRKVKDYFGKEEVQGQGQSQTRENISKTTIKGFLERLALAEEWLLKNLLGDNYTVVAAAVNVRVFVKKKNVRSESLFGDLYVVRHVLKGDVSFKLYSPKDNKFIWSVDKVSIEDSYVDLSCNTHILHMGDSIYTFKFPDKKERIVFRDNLNKFLYLETSKRPNHQSSDGVLHKSSGS